MKNALMIAAMFTVLASTSFAQPRLEPVKPRVQQTDATRGKAAIELAICNGQIVKMMEQKYGRALRREEHSFIEGWCAGEVHKRWGGG